MDVTIFYGLLMLTVQLAHIGAKKTDFCNTVHWGSLVQGKVRVPHVSLPAGRQDVSARIPQEICGKGRFLSGISVVACDLGAHEVPDVQIVGTHHVRVQRLGHAWISRPGSLHILVSCELVPVEIEVPNVEFRRLDVGLEAKKVWRILTALPELMLHEIKNNFKKE